jgi:hypothetical protein
MEKVPICPMRIGRRLVSLSGRSKPASAPAPLPQRKPPRSQCTVPGKEVDRVLVHGELRLKITLGDGTPFLPFAAPSAASAVPKQFRKCAGHRENTIAQNQSRVDPGTPAAVNINYPSPSSAIIVRSFLLNPTRCPVDLEIAEEGNDRKWHPRL